MQLPPFFVGKIFYRLFCSQVDSGTSCSLSTKWSVPKLTIFLFFTAGRNCYSPLFKERKQLFQCQFQCRTNLQQDLQIWLQTASESHGQLFTLLFFTHSSRKYDCYIRLDGQCKAASSQKWTGAKERTISQRQAIMFPISLLLWKENSCLFELQVIPISHGLP